MLLGVYKAVTIYLFLHVPTIKLNYLTFPIKNNISSSKIELRLGHSKQHNLDAKAPEQCAHVLQSKRATALFCVPARSIQRRPTRSIQHVHVLFRACQPLTAPRRSQRHLNI